MESEEKVSTRLLRPEARLGAALRATRVERGISLRALARNLYRAHSGLVEYERGHRLAPLDIVQAYERELGVTRGTLVALHQRAHRELYGDGWDRSGLETRRALPPAHSTLHQLLADVASLAGREMEPFPARAPVAESMASGGPVVIVAIISMSDVDTLAVRLAHELVPQFLDAQVHVSLQGRQEPVAEQVGQRGSRRRLEE